MKKQFLAPLCSGLVIPGLGQLLNAELKKGGYLLAAVFILFIAGTVKLYFLLRLLFEDPNISAKTPGELSQVVQGDPVFCILMLLFAGIWIYSVIDAFLVGKRLDRSSEESEG